MLLGNRRQKQEEARKCVAEFVNSDSDDLVFVQNTTTGKSYDLKCKNSFKKNLENVFI
jgi:selenocysteine lyase/cysteine desulfurase